RGHALLGELEVVGAVEAALFGLRVGRDPAPLRGGGGLRHVVESGVAVADECDVTGSPPLVYAVYVDVGERLLKRVERVLGVVLRAEQALLFRRDGEEEDRALRGSLKFGERLGPFEQRRHARSVVNRA